MLSYLLSKLAYSSCPPIPIEAYDFCGAWFAGLERKIKFDAAAASFPFHRDALPSCNNEDIDWTVVACGYFRVGSMFPGGVHTIVCPVKFLKSLRKPKEATAASGFA